MNKETFKDGGCLPQRSKCSEGKWELILSLKGCEKVEWKDEGRGSYKALQYLGKITSPLWGLGSSGQKGGICGFSA